MLRLKVRKISRSITDTFDIFAIFEKHTQQRLSARQSIPPRPGTPGRGAGGEQFKVLEPNDVLLMYENGIGVVAVGTVLEKWDQEQHSPPIYFPPIPGNKRHDHEYRIKVKWFLDLSEKPISVTELKKRFGSTPRGAIRKIVKWRTEIEEVIDEHRSGFDKLADDLAEIFKKDLAPTTKEALVNARIGQGAFRTQVLQCWDNRCSVTGAETTAAIRASHIRPWSESSDLERLDPNNGLPLIANLDALFDRHLISFESSGQMIVSPVLSASERKLLQLDGQKLSKPLSAEVIGYLEYHRNEFFGKFT